MGKVVFLHPDLGIGGAERAMVDAALALQAKGHSVHFITAHHNPSHCFQETSDGTFPVTVCGDWLPRKVFGRFYALCAYIRMVYAAIYLLVFSGLKPDVVICDQVSACIPVLRLGSAGILFYCHFPDLLLCKRESRLKEVYRYPLDHLEEWSTGLAHCVLVNSRFTGQIFHETFKSLSHIKPEVLYPIPNFSAFDGPVEEPSDELIPPGKKSVFLSINRYERKKNLNLAVGALAKLKEKVDSLRDIHLVMAGGYDERVTENKEHYLELRRAVTETDLDDHVTFLRSISGDQKNTLLKHCTCLLYTPDREHFGIVPVEAMYMRCPVIAVASGGPLETIRDGHTGYLCQQTEEAFAEAMHKFVLNKNLSSELGKAGHKHVVDNFSFTVFTEKLNDIVTGMIR